MSAEIDTLHIPFIGYLKSQGFLFRRSRTDRKTTEAKGEPDFSIYEGGRALFIEMKQPKTGKLSKDQVFRHAEYAKVGCRVFVVRELSAAIELVTAWRQFSPLAAEHCAENERLTKIGNAMWRDIGNGKMERVRTVL